MINAVYNFAFYANLRFQDSRILESMPTPPVRFRYRSIDAYKHKYIQPPIEEPEDPALQGSARYSPESRRAYLTLLTAKINMSVLQELCWKVYQNLF